MYLMCDDMVRMNELMRMCGNGKITYAQCHEFAKEFEFHSIRFCEIGMALFERAFMTWSLRTLCDQGPVWFKMCHQIGDGWWSCCENVLESSHTIV